MADVNFKIESVGLDQFDKTEWRDVARKLKPEWTEQEFEDAWDEFCALKYRSRLQ